MLFGIVLCLAPCRAGAETVDTELLLLVDISNGGLKKGEFDSLMGGYASALTSSQVLDAIQSGNVGRIAVSLMFFGGDPVQPTGVAWMSIGGLAEAQTFASQLQALPEPAGGNFSYGDSLAYATASFGTETGGATTNGFESAVQIIEVAGASRPKGNATNVDAATADALAAGVDLIGATAIGNKTDQIESYYATHVVGGTVGDTGASVATNDLSGGLEQTLADQISRSVAGGATAVPEPSPALLLISSLAVLGLFIRRRA
jgi:hypothetical protein